MGMMTTNMVAFLLAFVVFLSTLCTQAIANPRSLYDDWEDVCPQPFAKTLPSCPRTGRHKDVSENRHLPVSNTTQGPWTHKPYCIEAYGREEEDDEIREEVNEVDEDDDSAYKYCLYTNANFGTNGLSVVTLPKHSIEVARDMERVITSNFPSLETVQHLVSDYSSIPATAVVDMPDKGGKGVVALRRIRRFETFLVDFASLTVDTRVRSALHRRALQKIMDQAAAQLRDPIQGVLSLSQGSSHVQSHVDEKQADDDGIVDNVLRTNSFQNRASSWLQASLFPLISRINHDCQPNAFLRLSLHGLTTGAAAFRDIEPGEEITISYIPLGLVHNERQKQLRQWGFECHCPLCTASEDAVEVSDAYRSSLSKLRSALDAAKSNWNLVQAAHLAEEGLEKLASLEDEDDDNDKVDDYASIVATYAPHFHAILAGIAAVSGDDEKAAHHARIASNYRVNLAYLESRDHDVDFKELMASFE